MLLDVTNTWFDESWWGTLAFVLEAHEGQKDKNGDPFILHPLAVSLKAMEIGRKDLMIPALLHDVIEDTDAELSDLTLMGHDERTVRIVDKMTRWDGLSYGDYIEQVCEDIDAMVLKLLDLEHNMDPVRGYYPGLHRRYRKAQATIQGRLK